MPASISSHPVLSSFQSCSPNGLCGALLGSMCSPGRANTYFCVAAGKASLGLHLPALQVDFGLVTHSGQAEA